jgi:hypothetical protein
MPILTNSYKGAQSWVRISVKVFSLFSAYKEKSYSSQEYRDFFERAGFTVVEQKEVMGSSLMTIGTKKEGQSGRFYLSSTPGT